MLTMLIFLMSCTTKPEAINYGEDQCHYCMMTIVDKQYAGELVTNKGRVYKYDAVECLIGELNRTGEDKFSHMLVNNYDYPGNLNEAASSFYLVSENLPSPMGANITAFSKAENRDKVHESKGGDIFSWNELRRQKFN